MRDSADAGPWTSAQPTATTATRQELNQSFVCILDLTANDLELLPDSPTICWGQIQLCKDQVERQKLSGGDPAFFAGFEGVMASGVCLLSFRERCAKTKMGRAVI